MDRDELGRALYVVDATKSSRAWEDIPEYVRELYRKSAYGFVGAIGLVIPTQREPTRAFYARVSLMGKRSLGLCRVTEAPLAGVTMLRCEKDGAVEWVNPAAVYSIAEVPDAVAEAEIASARRHAQEVQAEAERRAAQLQSERAAATACVVVDAESKMVGAVASEPGLLRLSDSALSAAIAANGLNGFSFSTLYVGERYDLPIGFSTYATEDISDRLVAVMRAIGFSGANVREAVGDELISIIPF